jgi:hypothetical protein
MDMMTIKNKKIQRDIISIFGNLKSVEFSYFLISLLKDEYAISGDIISILTLLPDVELKEIDHFIINIFKNYVFYSNTRNKIPKFLNIHIAFEGMSVTWVVRFIYNQISRLSSSGTDIGIRRVKVHIRRYELTWLYQQGT